MGLIVVLVFTIAYGLGAGEWALVAGLIAATVSTFAVYATSLRKRLR